MSHVKDLKPGFLKCKYCNRQIPKGLSKKAYLQADGSWRQNTDWEVMLYHYDEDHPDLLEKIQKYSCTPVETGKHLPDRFAGYRE